MLDAPNQRLLEALLDSWDRNNTILLNLLRALPEGGLEASLLQHMLWHEGYHHGQIKLALKLAGRPMIDEEAGPVTWGVWMRKK
jgi:uncharacterized damage-inducible protein DinB